MASKNALRLYFGFVIGFALILTFNGPAGAYWMVGAEGDGTSFPLSFMYRIGQALSFAVIAMLSRRLYPLHGRTVGIAVASLLCLGGSLFVGLSPQAPALTTAGAAPALVTAIVVVGAASSMLYLAWFELMCQLKISVTLGCFAASYLVSGVLSLGLLCGKSGFAALVISCALPVCALPLFLSCSERLGSDAPCQGEKPRSGWSFPLRPVVLMAVVAFANSIIGASLPEGGQSLSPWGACGAGVLVLAVVALKGSSLDPRWLLQLSLPLIIAAALGVMLDLNRFGPVSTLLSNAAFVCFIVFISTVLCAMVFRYGINPLWLLGCVFAARTAASCLAAAAGPLFLQDALSAGGGPFIMAVIIVVLAALYPVSYTFRDAYSSWGVHLARLEKSHGEGEETPAGLYAACMVASRMYGMTHREEEILFYLAQDMTLAAIGERLCLSTATVKTHTQHIYKKAGVHSKAELIALLEH